MMIRFGAALFLSVLAGCVKQPAAPPATTLPPPPPPPAPALQEPVPRPAPRLLAPLALEMAGDLRARLGADAADEVLAADVSLFATYHAGLPKPVQRPDGRWGYEAPFANAAIRTAEGWVGWKNGIRRPLTLAAADEIEHILRDPAFWHERETARPTCTDGGARRLAVRFGSRTVERQQTCAGSGLTGRLFDLVLNGG